MTKGEAIYRLRSSIKEVSRDSRYSNRHLWNLLWTTAKKLMLRDKNKLSNQNIFTRFEFKTEEVNLLTSCVPIDCNVCRIKLPDTVESKEGLVYQYIGPPDFSKNFKVVSPQTFRTLLGTRNPSKYYGFIDSGYLYLSKCYPCVIGLMLTDEITGCSQLNSLAPIPGYVFDYIIKEGIQELAPALTKPADIVANKNDRA